MLEHSVTHLTLGAASYPDVFTCAQRKAGRMVPCGSSPVTRSELASAMQKTKEEAALGAREFSCTVSGFGQVL